ncbi:hypothetical protein PCE1_001692 [Barthelona sp. PCE]
MYHLAWISPRKKYKKAFIVPFITRLVDLLGEKLIFIDELYFDLPVEEWPKSLFCIPYLCSKVPVDKTRAYIEAGSKALCNIDIMLSLMDRRIMNDVLTDSRAPCIPLFDDPKSIEGPVIEKPLDAENHDVRIYYDNKTVFLHRKTKDRCSFEEENSCIYRSNEEMVYSPLCSAINNLDIKVYAFNFNDGKDEVFAESRPSPVHNHFVQRDENGQEKREAVQLTAQEREEALRIAENCEHLVCGMDLLRYTENGVMKHAWIDINGFSVVKRHPDALEMLAEKMFEHVNSLVNEHSKD